MNNSTLLALLLFGTLPAFAATDLKTVLELKPGTKLHKSLVLEESHKDFSYEIEKENDVIQSVKVDFTLPVEPSQFIKGKTEGFCLVQKPEGDIKLNRYFFFDIKNLRRYELTPHKKILSILIQDIPGARTNKPCTFDNFEIKEGK